MRAAKRAMKRARIRRWVGKFAIVWLKNRLERDTIIVNPSRM